MDSQVTIPPVVDVNSGEVICLECNEVVGFVCYVENMDNLHHFWIVTLRVGGAHEICMDSYNLLMAHSFEVN